MPEGMLVFLISLTLLYLSFNNGDTLKDALEDRDVYHTLFGNIGSTEDLFLKEPNGTAPTPAPDDMLAADDNDTLDEPDLEIVDIFGFLRTNLTSQTFDLHDFFIINDQYSNFTKEYKNKSINEIKSMNEMKNKTRRNTWEDPDDLYFNEHIEHIKKQQLRMILVQFTMHCRYEVGKALQQRDFIRDDKRYKLGYLFNRMRRLKTDQLKMVGAAWHQEITLYRHTYTLMRMYERVVHFDVDMRDTANMIKEVFKQEAPYDTFILPKLKKDKIFLPFVQSANRTRSAGNGSYFYEPVDAIDIAFDEFPKLSDVLPTLVQKTPLDYDDMPGVTVKNMSIDLETIDINKFRKKMDVITGMIAKDEPKYYNASRRQQYIDSSIVPEKYMLGLGQFIRRRCLDLMLQVLYMTRHKVKKLQENKYFSTTDTGFRIAYTFRMLLRIHTRMMQIFSYSWHNREAYYTPSAQIIMHGKVTRLHVDFCYLWWVLINVDGAYQKGRNVRQHKKELNEALKEHMALLALKNAENKIKVPTRPSR